jgi:hypothetical protein
MLIYVQPNKWSSESRNVWMIYVGTCPIDIIRLRFWEFIKWYYGVFPLYIPSLLWEKYCFRPIHQSVRRSQKFVWQLQYFKYMTFLKTKSSYIRYKITCKVLRNSHYMYLKCRRSCMYRLCNETILSKKGLCNLQKGCTRLAAASDKVY